MAFAIYADSGANLTPELIKRFDIKIIPFTYAIGDDVYECSATTDDSEAHKFYDMLRNKVVVKTSMIKADRSVKEFIRHKRYDSCRSNSGSNTCGRISREENNCFRLSRCRTRNGSARMQSSRYESRRY